ncbi:hypothetical protein JCM5350_003095 [Sporobolomyces pararoseus]
MDDTFNTQLNGGDTSLAGYASTAGLSTREPLKTRIVDVPDDYRGSWERTKRTKVAEVVVQAIGEVLDGLARAAGRERDEEWRTEAVQVRGIVRGTEEELAKLVHGLMKIARGLRIDFEGPSSTPRTTYVVVDPGPSTRRPPLASKDLSKPSSNQSLSPSNSTTRPPSLFATRPLRQPVLPVKPLTRSVSSSISSSSSHSSRSTSLTIPHPHHRPSLFNELEKSGTLSPPPRMPGSPRRHQNRLEVRKLEEEEEGKKKRSTLELMRDSQTRRGTIGEAEDIAEVKRKDKGKGKEKEIDDVFSTPRDVVSQNNLKTQAIGGGTTSSKASRKRVTEGLAKTKSLETDQSTVEEKTQKVKGKEKRASDQKGKERAREEVRPVERIGASSSTEVECCRECRAELSSGKEQVSTFSGPDSATLPSQSQRDRPHPVNSQSKKESSRTRRSLKWCQCQSEEREDCSSSTTAEEEEEENASSSSTLGKSARTATRHNRSRNKRTKDRDKNPATELSASISSSQPARRVRVARIDRTSKPASSSEQEAGDLSVHGESEIERFEATHQSSSSPLVDNSQRQPSQPMTPPSSSPQHDPTHSTTTPSPYTMLLLAQRARLAEKLRALELRERDRIAARQALEGAQG